MGGQGVGDKVRGQGVGDKARGQGVPLGGERAAQRFYPLNCEPLCGRNNFHCLLLPPPQMAGVVAGEGAICYIHR